MTNSARASNELRGIKRPSSVLVRGFSALDIAIQAGLVPNTTNEAQFIEFLRGPRGYSTFELWLTLPGNANKTIDDYWLFLGLQDALATTAILAMITAAQVQTGADVVSCNTATAATAANAATTAADVVTTNGLQLSAAAHDTAALSSAVAAAASAAAAAASAGSFNKASAADIRTQTDDAKYTTSKGLSDAVAWIDSSGALAGEYIAGTWTPDLKKGYNRSVTMTANTVLAAPLNPIDGQTYQWMLTEDGTGGRTITPNAKFSFGSVAAAYNTAANAINIISGTYHAGLDKVIGCTVWHT